MSFLSSIRDTVSYYTNQAVEKVKQINPSDIQQRVARTFSEVKYGCFDFLNFQIEGGGYHVPPIEAKEGEEEEKKAEEVVVNDPDREKELERGEEDGWEEVQHPVMKAPIPEDEPGVQRAKDQDDPNNDLLDPYPEQAPGGPPVNVVRRRRKNPND